MKVVFDFDGTLCNSIPKLAKIAIKLVLDEYVEFGIDFEEAEDWYFGTVGLSFPEQLEMCFPGNERNNAVAEKFARLQAEVYKNSRIFDDVYEALELLKEANVGARICSSSPSKLTWIVIKKKLDGYSFIITGRESGTKFEQLQKHFGGGEQGVFVGDAIRDGLLAQRLDIPFIGVTTTFTEDVFEANDMNYADSVLSAVTQILEAA